MAADYYWADSENGLSAVKQFPTMCMISVT